jgi:hypothetical protein
MSKRGSPNAIPMEESQTRSIGKPPTTPLNTTPLPPIIIAPITTKIPKCTSPTKSL